MKCITIVAASLIGLSVCIGAALSYGASRWRANTKGFRARIQTARTPIGQRVFERQEIETLPPPVQRYFSAVLQDGQPFIAEVSVDQAGTFNMSEGDKQWKPFTATQHVVTRRPGFDWDARIAMAPGISVRVHDAYAAGEGILHASLFGLVTLADMRGTPEAAEGELMRFLAEAVWYPTSLLPSRGVRWKAVDATSATATLTDGDTTVSLLFEFNEKGLIDSVHAGARWRTVGGAFVATPWAGRFWQYELRDGMRVPTEGEVAWLLPEGRQPYWRGRITNLNYGFAL